METNMQELFGPWAGAICTPFCSHPSCWRAKQKARQGIMPEPLHNICWLEGLERNKVTSAVQNAKCKPKRKASYVSPSEHSIARPMKNVLSQTGPWCYATFFVPENKKIKTATHMRRLSERKVHFHYLNEQVKLPDDKHAKLGKTHKQAHSIVSGKTSANPSVHS